MALTEPFEGAMIQAPQGLNKKNLHNLNLDKRRGTEQEIENERVMKGTSTKVEWLQL